MVTSSVSGQPGFFLNSGIVGGAAVFDANLIVEGVDVDSSFGASIVDVDDVNIDDLLAASTVDVSTTELFDDVTQRFGSVVSNISEEAKAFYGDVTVAFGGNIPALLAYEFVTRAVPEAMNVVMSVNLDGGEEADGVENFGAANYCDKMVPAANHCVLKIAAGALDVPAPGVVCREVGLPRPRPSCVMFHYRSDAESASIQPGFCFAWPLPSPKPVCMTFHSRFDDSQNPVPQCRILK